MRIALAFVLVACEQSQPPPRPVNSAPAPAPAPAPPAVSQPVVSGLVLTPSAPSTTQHAGCFARPQGITDAAAHCFWTPPGSDVELPVYQCATTRERCEAERARYREMVGDRVTPCFERVGAICTDLGDGAGVRRCFADRRQCEAIRDRHQGGPCAHRPTF